MMPTVDRFVCHGIMIYILYNSNRELSSHGRNSMRAVSFLADFWKNVKEYKAEYFL